MHLKAFAICAVAVLSLSFALLTSGCKSENMPPPPASLINNTRDRLNPFRFTFATEPSAPSIRDRITLRVHVIDAANQPADGVEVSAELSMPGVSGPRVTLGGTGNGDYEGEVDLETAGSWDVDLAATRDDKSSKQRFAVEVGG
jgi:YtkA-like protein